MRRGAAQSHSNALFVYVGLETCRTTNKMIPGALQDTISRRREQCNIPDEVELYDGPPSESFIAEVGWGKGQLEICKNAL